MAMSIYVRTTWSRLGCCSNWWHRDSIFTDAFNDEFRTGIPSRASTASHASFTKRIGALFFDPWKEKEQQRWDYSLFLSKFLAKRSFTWLNTYHSLHTKFRIRSMGHYIHEPREDRLPWSNDRQWWESWRRCNGWEYSLFERFRWWLTMNIHPGLTEDSGFQTCIVLFYGCVLPFPSCLQ